MNSVPIITAFLCRAYLPHLCLLPIIIVSLWLCSPGMPESLHWSALFFRWVFRIACFAGFPATWVISSLLIGKQLITFGWLVRFWNGIPAWWKEMTTNRTEEEFRAIAYAKRGQNVHAFLTLLALAASIYGCIVLLIYVQGSVLLTCLTLVGIDLLLLTIALPYQEAYAAFKQTYNDQRANEALEQEEKKKEKEIADRDAARKQVQACYDEHAELLREAFPPIRFRAELKVRITDDTLPQDAWKQARDIIQELLTAVAAEKKNAPKAPPRSINPDDLDFR